MFGIDFAALPLAVNGLLFLAAGAAVWISGTRLAVHADAVAERTGLGRAFLGLVLLAGITELPECATSFTAVLVGDARLAINNLFGGIAMQTAILAVADALLRKGPLSYFTPKPQLLLQGIFLTGLLALVLAGMVGGEVVVVAGVGGWTTLVFVLYFLSLWLVRHFEAAASWRPVDLPDELAEQEGAPIARSSTAWSTRRLAAALVAVGLVILAAGSLLVGVGQAIAEQTGLGSSFVGATLIASTTSLPELSTTLAAVRLRAYDMAFGNIFGSNAIMVALLFGTDVLHRSGPVLDTVDRSATFGAAMGIAVTTVYLAGLVMRRHRVVLRMGVDSLVVLVLYGLTLVGFFALRHG